MRAASAAVVERHACAMFAFEWGFFDPHTSGLSYSSGLTAGRLGGGCLVPTATQSTQVVSVAAEQVLGLRSRAGWESCLELRATYEPNGGSI